MAANTTDTSGEVIAGLPSAVFVLIIGVSVLLGFCLFLFPLIYCSRYCEQRGKRQAIEAEEAARYGYGSPKRGGFFSFFGRGRGRSGTMNDPWIERIDPETQRTYYEHSRTGKSTTIIIIAIINCHFFWIRCCIYFLINCFEIKLNFNTKITI